MSREVKCQVWLTENGRPVLGEEQAVLLRLVKVKGSVPDVAQALGITGRQTWSRLRRIERDAGIKIVASRRSGPGRGSSVLTPEGEHLLEEFENKKHRVDEQLAHLFKNPTLTTDGIVLVNGQIVLIKRGNEPGKGKYALLGGFVEYGETLEACVVREVYEETGLRAEVLDLVGIYSHPDRDPRGHIVTALFYLRARGGELKAGDDAAGVAVHDLDRLPELAFDHGRMISDFLRTGRKRAF
jgi:8-oxo-dGTP diphosphatase